MITFEAYQFKIKHSKIENTVSHLWDEGYEHDNFNIKREGLRLLSEQNSGWNTASEPVDTCNNSCIEQEIFV